jgi:peptidoglycan/LPS O-acetylase OafA/YrhL
MPHGVAGGALASGSQPVGTVRAQRVDELPNLDVLRAIAVGFVLCNHVSETVSPLIGVSLHPWDSILGRLGVLAFFVHTSLVLMQSLERSRLKGRTMFVNFYVRRVFRIYPLSLLCVGLVLAMGVTRVPWEATVPHWTTAQIVSNLLLIQNLTFSPSILAPLWSLPYELQMYVVLPFVFWSTRRWPPLTVALVGWCLAVAAGLVQPLIPGLSRLDLAQYGPCFLAGVVAFALMTRVRPWLPSAAWVPCILGLALAYVAVAAPLDMIHPAWLAWTFCLALGLVLPSFHQVVSTPVRAGAHYVARYSYGIYLGHMVGLWLGFGGAGPKHLLSGSLVFLGSLVVFSVGGYHLVEKPFIDLGGRVSRRLSGLFGSDMERRETAPANSLPHSPVDVPETVPRGGVS